MALIKYGKYKQLVTGLLFCVLSCHLQAKRTKKVGIVGKYGTRYGASLRKMVKKIEISQHAKYTCSFCGKVRAAIRVITRLYCVSVTVLNSRTFCWKRNDRFLCFIGLSELAIVLILFCRPRWRGGLLVSGTVGLAWKQWLEVPGLTSK